MPTDCTQDYLQLALSAHGLSLRGSFAPVATDKLPILPNGAQAASVWVVGVIGSAFWPHFKSSSFHNDGQPDPLDRWSRAIGEELAARFGGLALFPFDGPPYHPFQRWADRAEPTQPSRMMLRIHPDFGLWHAYRFALALPLTPAAAVTPVQATTSADLCATCSGQPCLQSCPVGAYTGETFLLNACASHLHSGGGGECMQSGCLARRACPVGSGFMYTEEHAAFHMRAFAQNH
jgi:ferredoxin